MFSLTVHGRAQAQALDKVRQTGGNGRSLSSAEVLRWLIELEQAAPESFDSPSRLIDAGVETGFIEGA